MRQAVGPATTVTRRGGTLVLACGTNGCEQQSALPDRKPNGTVFQVERSSHSYHRAEPAAAAFFCGPEPAPAYFFSRIVNPACQLAISNSTYSVVTERPRKPRTNCLALS